MKSSVIGWSVNPMTSPEKKERGEEVRRNRLRKGGHVQTRVKTKAEIQGMLHNPREGPCGQGLAPRVVPREGDGSFERWGLMGGHCGHALGEDGDPSPASSLSLPSHVVSSSAQPLLHPDARPHCRPKNNKVHHHGLTVLNL